MTEPRDPLEILASDLRDSPSALPFARAVFTQLARGPGAYAASSAPEIDSLARRISRMFHAAESGDSSIGDELAAQPLIAAAFFQNIDLLYDSRFPRADLVSVAIGQALQTLSEDDGGC